MPRRKDDTIPAMNFSESDLKWHGPNTIGGMRVAEETTFAPGERGQPVSGQLLFDQNSSSGQCV
eukprot:scaffold391449_cov24-Prasinocladus_malaysianus.AAC.2